MNLNMTGQVDPSKAHDIALAFTDAVHYSNEATAASKAGDYRRAAELHEKALALKIRGLGEETTQAAISMEGLGETYIKLNRLEEADELLGKALKIRELKGEKVYSAVTRESIGALREGQGRWEEAAEVRRRGAAAKEILCSYENCSPRMFGMADLRTCAACKAPLYHSVGCQKKDWRLRHKVLCQARRT